MLMQSLKEKQLSLTSNWGGGRQISTAYSCNFFFFPKLFQRRKESGIPKIVASEKTAFTLKTAGNYRRKIVRDKLD